MPTYRRQADLLRCLRSVQEQTLETFEVVVVDNAADPHVEAALKAFNADARVAAGYVPEPRLFR